MFFVFFFYSLVPSLLPKKNTAFAIVHAIFRRVIHGMFLGMDHMRRDPTVEVVHISESMRGIPVTSGRSNMRAIIPKVGPATNEPGSSPNPSTRV